MAQPECPEIDPALVRYLERVFPDRVVDPDKEDPRTAFGSIRVVRHLRLKLLEQEEGPEG